MTARSVVLSIAVVLAPATMAAAQEATTEAPAFAFRYAFKASGLFSHAPDAPELFPEPTSARGYWRLRAEPTFRVGTFTFESAIEQRTVFFSDTNASGDPLLAETAAPWRIRPLVWNTASIDHTEWRLELDRAAAHGQVGAAEITVGRQAIGWGRGVVFGAVDLFSPFSPLEPDREWRRGVDAARADIRLSDTASLDVVTAFGGRVDESIYAARLRGYSGRIDVELIGGRRARDAFGGVTSSVAIAGAEVHGELAAFHLPSDSTPLFSNTVLKALAGVSWRIPVGNGILMFAEYHYSGFGAPAAAGMTRYAVDPEVRLRYGRGDMQLLTRHAIAALGTYEQSPEMTWAVQWLQSPVDGSGVLVPSATFTFSDRASLVFTAYLPYGREPQGRTYGSDFGAAPLALFTQLRFYR